MSSNENHSPPEVEYRNPGMIRALSTGMLTSGLPYQRPVRQEKIDQIIREWNPRKLTPVIVSFRDGKFNVVDGQHHIEAMRQKASGRDVIVPCIIHTGLTYREEADMYAALDTDKTALTPRQHTKALVEAGTRTLRSWRSSALQRPGASPGRWTSPRESPLRLPQSTP